MKLQEFKELIERKIKNTRNFLDTFKGDYEQGLVASAELGIYKRVNKWLEEVK